MNYLSFVLVSLVLTYFYIVFSVISITYIKKKFKLPEVDYSLESCFSMLYVLLILGTSGYIFNFIEKFSFYFNVLSINIFNFLFILVIHLRLSKIDIKNKLFYSLGLGISLGLLSYFLNYFLIGSL